LRHRNLSESFLIVFLQQAVFLFLVAVLKTFATWINWTFWYTSFSQHFVFLQLLQKNDLGYPCCWKKNQHSDWRKYLSEKYPGVVLKILPCSLFHDLMHFSRLLLCLLLHHPITLLLSSKFVKRTPIYGHKINQAASLRKKTNRGCQERKNL